MPQSKCIFNCKMNLSDYKAVRSLFEKVSNAIINIASLKYSLFSQQLH